jgi:geranylgeranyl diphosphate synthase type II
MITQNTNDFPDIYSELRKIIERKINLFLKKTKPSFVYEPCRYILSTGGKRVRGVLVFLTCNAAGGILNNCINSAVAIELLHLFTLVHDDIMDNADRRRGFTTIHKKWDASTAILTGDILIGLAYNILLKTKTRQIDKIVKTFTNAIIEVCEGQAYDKEFESRDEITLPEYYKMIDKKTAKLIETAAIIGGLLGNSNTKQTSALEKFGALIGRAFQISDDLLDITGTEKELGKNIFSDIKECKKTYLYTQANNLFTRKDFLQLKDLYLCRNKTEKQLKQILELYYKYNIIEKAVFEIELLIKKAKRFLSVFPNNKRRLLEDFSDMLETRKY